MQNLRTFIKNKVIFKEHTNLNSLSQNEQFSKLHQCSFNWSDKCSHCEIAFDELKQKLSSSIEPNEETLNELGKQIKESLVNLEGVFFSLPNLQNYC